MSTVAIPIILTMVFHGTAVLPDDETSLNVAVAVVAVTCLLLLC